MKMKTGKNRNRKMGELKSINSMSLARLGFRIEMARSGHE